MKSQIRSGDALIRQQLERERAEETFEPRSYSLTDYEPYGRAYAHLVSLRERLKGAMAPAEATVREARDRVRQAELGALEAQAKAFQEHQEPDPAPLKALEQARVELQRAEERLVEAKRGAAALELAVQRQEVAVKALEEAARQHVREQARRDHGPAVKQLVAATVAFAEALRAEQAVAMGASRVLGTNHGLARELPPPPAGLLRRSPLERSVQALREAGYSV